MSSQESYTADDHQHWEIEKLKAEVRSLTSPVLLRPGFWFSVITAGGVVFGIVLQYYSSAKTNTLAEIKSEQAKLDAQKAEMERDKAHAELEQANKRRLQAEAAIAAAEEKRQELENEITKLDEDLKERESKHAAFSQQIAQLNTVVTKLKAMAKTDDIRNTLKEAEAISDKLDAQEKVITTNLKEQHMRIENLKLDPKIRYRFQGELIEREIE